MFLAFFMQEKFNEMLRSSVEGQHNASPSQAQPSQTPVDINMLLAAINQARSPEAPSTRQAQPVQPELMRQFIQFQSMMNGGN